MTPTFSGSFRVKIPEVICGHLTQILGVFEVISKRHLYWKKITRHYIATPCNSFLEFMSPEKTRSGQKRRSTASSWVRFVSVSTWRAMTCRWAPCSNASAPSHPPPAPNLRKRSEKPNRKTNHTFQKNCPSFHCHDSLTFQKFVQNKHKSSLSNLNN